VTDWFTGAPFWIAFLALLGIVFARAQLTYWAGRAVVAGAHRTRLSERMDSPRMTSVVASLNRWGPPMITLSFLTIGLQTAVNAAAGLTRMWWPKYTAWMLPGCLAWAAIYATVGMAAAAAWVALAARSAWAPWVAFAVLAAVVAVVVLLRRRQASATDRAQGVAEA
jgi:membrane protein DedA with SNARE-associated domain